jgi:hypothetical protein
MVTAVSQVTASRVTDGTSPSAAAALSSRELRALQAAGRKLDAHDPAVVRQVASQLLTELFFGPLLAEMRRFPFGREVGSGGQTEAVFGEQLDQRIADHVAAADQGTLKQITRRLEPKTTPATGAAKLNFAGTAKIKLAGTTSWPVQVRMQGATEQGAS